MQIMAGYIAAQVLFNKLDKALADDIADKWFAVTSYFGLAVWFLVYLLAGAKPGCWIAL
ncbi:hypothetical protein C7N83_10900 [Neisseria iguanae]|uniref:TMEM205-like domain-containing protein n=2 Tax=Neisseria iguanae TaxID=90242 RepID=A0A2P7TY60_9NEIS|nr:hypothetical protein C7N83_10900 [Neisseria iguanae]